MKRHRFGINLDEGIPLSSDQDFELLHVPCFNDISGQLLEWTARGEKPSLLGGQIGSGKSTLIRYVFNNSIRKPDVEIHFDKDSLNKDVGDFWGITLAEFIKTALMHHIELSFSKLPEELGGYRADDWNSLLNGICPAEFSSEVFKVKKELREKIVAMREYIGKTTIEIGMRLQERLKRLLFIFASGVDKFNQGSAAFLEMEEVLVALASFKTLYEVNVIHLFPKPGTVFSSMERLFIPAAQQETVTDILEKRLGVYAQPVRPQLKALAQWSGGNPRQAVRLLSHFETARKNRKRKFGENLAIAISETASDFFAYSPKPSQELILVTKNTAKMETSLLYLPGDRDTAVRALYGNWILIKKLGQPGTLEVTVNPLVKGAFDTEINPEEPEFKMLSEYSGYNGISGYGLDFNVLDHKTGKEKSGDQLHGEYFASAIEHPVQVNLTEVFEILSGALMAKDRPDWVIIAFRDPSVLEAARAYLFAKANSYEYQRYRHIAIKGGKRTQPLLEMEKFLSEDTDIFSIEFSGKWENEHLETLDRQRDRFINLQMIWWIPYQDLKDYLPRWIQLRQLFEIFVLEDELLGSISAAEVEADLSFFNDLVENEQSSEANVVNNLKIVLEYLKKNRAVGDEKHR
jgi:hypothetical protein